MKPSLLDTVPGLARVLIRELDFIDLAREFCDRLREAVEDEWYKQQCEQAAEVRASFREKKAA